MNHEIGIRHVYRNFRALAADSVEQCLADVKIQRVAEFVGTGDAAGFDAGREVARVMASEAAAAERAEKILKSFEAEKINGLVRDLEARFSLALVGLPKLAAGGSLWWRRDLWRLLRIDEAFLGKAFHQFVEKIFDGLIVLRIWVLQHFAELFAHGVFGEQVTLLQRAKDGFAESFHRAVRIHLGNTVELRFKAALQKKIAHALDELFEVDRVGRFAGVFSVANESHGRRSLVSLIIKSRSLVVMLLGMTTLRRVVN